MSLNKKGKSNNSKKNQQPAQDDEHPITQEMVDSFRLSMDPKAIPDLDELIEIINDMMEFMDTPVMKELEMRDRDEFESVVHMKYNNTIIPFRIIVLLTSEDRYDNLDRLLDMFDTLDKIKKGEKNIFEEADKFGEKKNEEYVYPNFGGKENFIKMLEDDKKKIKPKPRKNEKK